MTHGGRDHVGVELVLATLKKRTSDGYGWSSLTREIGGQLEQRRRQLVFTALDPVNGPRRELTRLAIDDPNTSYAADISLDGTRIAVAQKSTGLIRILSVNGRHLWEFTVKNYEVGLDWAADGKGLFFCGSTARGLAVVHVDLRGNTQIVWQQEGGQLPYGGGALGFPSRDGRRLGIWSESISTNVWAVQNF